MENVDIITSRKVLWVKLMFCLFLAGNVQCSDQDDLQLPSKENTDTKPNEDNDFNQLLAAIRMDNRNVVADSKVKGYLKAFDSQKGAFDDINYKDKGYSKWEPIKHIDRLTEFVFAYTNKASVYYGKDDLFNCIVEGLDFWHTQNPQAPNWWFNQISEPKKLGILLIWMREGIKHIPADLEKGILDRIKKDGGDPAKFTGANCTDVALHWIYRSCLSENKKDLNYALNEMFKTLAYTTGEGLQHDNSYFQHGSQIYIGGYGDEFLKGITQVAMYVKGTSYALKGEKLDILSKFMRETYYQTMRGCYMPYGILGRGVSRNNATRKAGTALFAKRMMTIDVEHKSEYEKIVARLEGKKAADYGVSPLHTHYFRADYTLHVRPKYTFDVRMVSRHTHRCEFGNEENYKGYYISDGSTNILVEGDEYFNIFPYWNWAQVPGTTAPQTDEIPLPDKGWEVPGTSVFAGGVSDGIYGASAYSYYDEHAGINTGANKSWFFFDNEVVCLGTVSSKSANVVKTTINQCHSKGKIPVLHDGKGVEEISKTTHDYLNPRWVHHNNVGYVFPDGGNIWISNVSRSGSWYDINHGQSKTEVSGDVFAIGFEHLKSAKNNPYSYIVLPALNTADEVERYVQKKEVSIVCNNNETQSVYHRTLKIWSTAFFVGGTVHYNGMNLTASKGCIVMVKETAKGQYDLYVADPVRSQSVVELKFKSSTGKEKVVVADFKGTGLYAGKTKNYKLVW